MSFKNNIWHKLGGHQWAEWAYVPKGDADYEDCSPCKQRRVCAWAECPKENEAKEFRITHRKLEWAYPFDEPESARCILGKVCKICKEREMAGSAISHTWDAHDDGWRSKSGHPCWQARTCQRCTHSEDRINHSWGNALYRYAPLMLDVADRQMNPLLSEWFPQFMRTLIKPADIGDLAGPIDNKWDYVHDSHCYQVQICENCRAIVERINHDWIDESAHPCIRARSCRRCLAMDLRRVHTWGKWREEKDSHGVSRRICTRCDIVELNYTLG